MGLSFSEEKQELICFEIGSRKCEGVLDIKACVALNDVYVIQLCRKDVLHEEGATKYIWKLICVEGLSIQCHSFSYIVPLNTSSCLAVEADDCSRIHRSFQFLFYSGGVRVPLQCWPSERTQILAVQGVFCNTKG